MSDTSWIRNQQQPTPNVIEQKPQRDTRSIVALTALILGTLLIVAGVGFTFGIFPAMLALGVVFLAVGLVLGFSKD